MAHERQGEAIPIYHPPMPARAAHRLLILGWDAADWNIIDPLMERGAMPHLKRLVADGVRADLRTLEPTLSPLLWSSIATGKTPDKHGILNFIEPNPSGDGVRIASSTSRRTKALWNMLTQSGMRVHVLGWYASHPAEPISGVCVSNLFLEGAPAGAHEPWPLKEGSVHADGALRERIAALRVHPAAAVGSVLRDVLPTAAQAKRSDTRPLTLAKEWARARSMHATALALLAHEQALQRPWDCLMVFHDTIDTIGHHFMELRPPRMEQVDKADVRFYGDVMDRVYMRHDEMLGELLAAVGPETTVLLISDHGFYSDHRRPVVEAWRQEAGAALEARWHRPEGVIVLSGPGFKRGEQIAAPRLLDVTPTALVALGLPVGADMDGRVVAEAFAQQPAIERIPSWDDRPGEAGMHPAEMRQDPFEARDALKQLIDLGYMPALGDDQERMLEVTRRETGFNLGTVLMTSGRPAEAIPIFAGLVTEKPEDPRYVIPLVQCQLAVCDTPGAIAALRAYLAGGKGIVDARILLAGALVDAGDAAEAAAEVEALAREHGERAMMALPLADLYARLERWPEAARYYAAAVEHDPKSPVVRVALARAALAQGQYEQAAEHCLDATELQMALPDAHYLLGVALAWLGDLENAQLSLGHAVAMQPGFLPAQEFLAAVARVAGDGECAAQAERQVAALEALLDGSHRRVEPYGAAAWLRSRA